LILGGTELSLILPEGTDAGVPILDTPKLHAEEVVVQMLSS
jgi:aspartate/glutamate racemase